jgi:hypothetical protein
MYLNTNLERSWEAWKWRLLIGPACIVDGLISTLTFGFLSTRLYFYCTKELSNVRFEQLRDNDACGRIDTTPL